MDNTFDIPVTYESHDYNFTAELIHYGYSYKIEVDVFGKIISFERDEEQRFRAVIAYDELQQRNTVDKALLQAIAGQLVQLFKD